MSQYYNAATGHLAMDCPRCGMLVEMSRALWGLTTQCTQCGTAFEAVPVIATIKRVDGKGPTQIVEKGLRLEPLENGDGPGK